MSGPVIMWTVTAVVEKGGDFERFDGTGRTLELAVENLQRAAQSVRAWHAENANAVELALERAGTWLADDYPELPDERRSPWEVEDGPRDTEA